LAGGGQCDSEFYNKLLKSSSTIAGLSVPLFFQPLSKIANRHYSKTQEGVMMARDEKTHVVTEALHGIRQVKFSAIESEWQKTIMAVRDHELGLQGRVYTWGLFLSFCWLAMPILLGAAALATYAWLNGTMTSSVAFTALSVFSSLEWTLSVVPVTITEYFDAKISVARIQQYLAELDKEKPTMESESVVFKNASITWPSRNAKEDAFALRNVNLEFPNKELRYA
jgi:ABC-type multidrug transport system fused ATPase/permease subunit